MEAEKNEQKNKQEKGKQENFVKIAISTTSGFYPDSGFDSVPSRQKVEVQLKKASNKLKLADTNGWVATVNKRSIDPARNYEENGLVGQVEIDWGPSEGGGGARA